MTMMMTEFIRGMYTVLFGKKYVWSLFDRAREARTFLNNGMWGVFSPDWSPPDNPAEVLPSDDDDDDESDSKK